MKGVEAGGIANCFRVVLLLSLFLLTQLTASAERLPIKTYTTEDGLIRNLIRQILQDSNGYLWLVTPSGLSRFDGYEFKHYLTEQDALLSLFWRMIEDRNGGYWIATMGGGLYKFRPDTPLKNSPSRFEHYPLGENPRSAFVASLLQDRAGRVWCGGEGGLYCLDEAGGGKEFRLVDLGLTAEERALTTVANVVEGREGDLWVATSRGLFRLLTDGRVVRYRLPPAAAQQVGHSFFDADGRLWAEYDGGLIVLMPEPAWAVAGTVNLSFTTNNRQSAEVANSGIRLPSAPGEAARFAEAEGFTGKDVTDICQSLDGKVWLGTYDKGLFSFDGRRFRLYGRDEGLSHFKVRSLAEDSEGNLWIGTDGGGLMKKVRGGFTGYTAADGIDETVIAFMIEDAERGVGVATDLRRFSRFDADTFTVLRGRAIDELAQGVLKENLYYYFTSPVMKDHLGEIWFSTSAGLYRFPRLNRIEQLATTPPKAIYTTRDGLPGNHAYRIFEDSRGDVWLSFLDPLRVQLYKWERATNAFRAYGKEDGLAVPENIASIAEDGAGNMWFGTGVLAGKGGQIVRYDGKRTRLFTQADGVPVGSIRDLFVDSRKRLWIASSRGGLARVDDPVAEQPRFFKYTVTDGLADNEINCVAEDPWGNIYVGMGRGLARINPETGRLRHYKGADGLTSDDVRKIFRDSQMNFWVGTSKGLFRFTPMAEAPQPAPSIFITRLIIAGEEQAISETGEKQIAEQEIDSDRNNLQIAFGSPNVSFATTTKYSYKLEGAGGDWSAPTDLRTVNYASLSPGRYRFLVRAVNSEGVASPSPAMVAFRVLPPVWQRWWFIGLTTILLALVAFVISRQRAARRREREDAETALRKARDERLRELEQVRRRIATDLHDDVGSSLTQIALLSEVAKQRADGSAKAVGEPLSLIARLSGELVDSMSDIVWAINPRKDYLGDLSQRMRHFASDVLTARGIEFRFRTPDGEPDVKVGANVRRELYLIFKEGINNVARHSKSAAADIEFQVEDDRLFLSMKDDGRGFDVEQQSSGHGLLSMEERCRSLGGELKIESEPGKGTTLTLVMPLKPQDGSANDDERR